MRELYLAWVFSAGGLCPYRMRHHLDREFRPLDAVTRWAWTFRGKVEVPADPRPPKSHRRLRNVLLAFAKLAEEEQVSRASMSMGRLG